MAPLGKPSTSTMFWTTVVLVNIVISLVSIHKWIILQAPTEYSYLDRDYPVEMPVGSIPTVEMTFHEVSRFGLSDVDSKANWETLFTNQFGIGFQHLGPYHFRFISGAYHSLHCIYTMQLDFDKPHHLEHLSHHFIHCLMYLRQIIICNADMTLEDGDFMQRNFTTDRMGQTRRCRDWSKVASWVDMNFKEWADYNEVSFDK